MYDAVNMDIPEAVVGADAINLIDEAVSLVLPSRPSAVKLGDPESSATKGAMVHISLKEAPLSIQPTRWGAKRRRLLMANPFSKPKLAAGITEQFHPPKSDE